MASNYLRAYPIRAILLAILDLGSAQNPHVLRVRSGFCALSVSKLAAVRIRCLPHYATRICFTESYGVKQSRRGERQVAYKVNGSASRQAGNFSR
ncbi:hypothetical protein DXN13_23875 [Salmonella enterica subsp. enterica serovar Enteritidis]|nr:hypothetical protein DXN13_23875 [Salmonella enterica subsp. enterica serovar Enteritidis]